MSQSPPDGVSFEDAMAELEQVVRDLEDGSISLDESLARYERGVGLIKRCYAQLRDAEQRILLVTGTDDGGQPVLQPFQHTGTEQSAVGAPRPVAPRPRPRPTTDR